MVKWGKIDVKAKLKDFLGFSFEKKTFSRFTLVNIFFTSTSAISQSNDTKSQIAFHSSHFSGKIFLLIISLFLCRAKWIFMRSVSYMEKCLNLCRGWKKKVLKCALSWELDVWKANENSNWNSMKGKKKFEVNFKKVFFCCK